MDTGLNRGPKGRQKGLTPKSRSQPPSKGRGKKGDIPRRNSGSRPPTNSRQVTVEEEAPSRTSAHNTAFQDRHGRLLSQGVDAAQARWKHHSDPMNVNQGKPNYRHVSVGPTKRFLDREKYNSIFDASKKHFHYVKGVRHYVIHGDELSSHMENTQKVSGLTDVVSFTNDTEYKLAYRGAFFYPFTFHMRLEYPPDKWTVEFARALVSFPEFDDRLIVYKTDGKKDINKGRTAEKLVEILGMSEPVALAATCAICCASRDLSRLLRHDVVREESDESVPVEKIVQNFFYGPVMAALAVKTSGTSRFKAYIRYKDEGKGTWVQQLGPTSRDARDIVELKLMATGGWSEKIKGNKRTSVDSTQSSNREPSGPISADNTAPRSRTIGSFLVPSTYLDPRLVSGRSRQTKPVYAKEYDPPDGEYLVHATDINSVVSIFKTGLVPGSIQHERAKHLQSLVPAQGTENGRTTVQFTAISNSKQEFLVRDKKDILLVFSGVAIATSYDCWEADDQPIISTPCQIRPDLIIAALTANHVLYEDESCPAFVVKNIAFWWSNYLKERDINLYDQGLATASQLKANRIFQPRKLVQASANACQRDDVASRSQSGRLNTTRTH